MTRGTLEGAMQRAQELAGKYGHFLDPWVIDAESGLLETHCIQCKVKVDACSDGTIAWGNGVFKQPCSGKA